MLFDRTIKLTSWLENVYRWRQTAELFLIKYPNEFHNTNWVTDGYCWCVGGFCYFFWRWNLMSITIFSKLKCNVVKSLTVSFIDKIDELLLLVILSYNNFCLNQTKAGQLCARTFFIHYFNNIFNPSKRLKTR